MGYVDNEETAIADYGLIGNSRAAALVSRNGSIDWCCLPEFDSASIFSALLDKKRGGCFAIVPSATYEATQQYIPETNVLETNFKTASGAIRLTDCFTAMTEAEKTRSLFPDHEILRIVEGISGAVSVTLDYSPTIFYGKYRPELKDDKKLGIRFTWKEHIYILLTTLAPGEIKFSNNKDRAFAEFNINAGERIIFSLTYSNQSPAVLAELETTAYSRMQNTASLWRNWIRQCKYSGLYHHHVKRSALTLKLLTHAPSGAIIAAPTTSLPEALGKDRNWDYRYCWLRDASFTIRVLVSLGFAEEAHAYMNWILHATRLTRPKLQVVYSVYGQASLGEKTLDWLSGYKTSRPVRVGNGADRQSQLDVYGEVLDAVYAYSPLIKQFDRSSKRFIIGLGKVICQKWKEPDNGIWEIRSSPVHHTHSKVMAWVGLDRLIKLCEKYQWQPAELETFKTTRTLIRREVEENGYNEALQSYTRELGGDDVDASLLVLPLVGFCDPQSPRMLGTIELIYETLSENNFLYRYRNQSDGLQGKEASFGICNFWLAENLAKSGRQEEAIEVFETTLQHASATGLLSEEIDARSGDLLGNYPQGFTHIGLINAALSINEAHLKKEGLQE
jgi:GH15 family glucan-1,4-alpha-glucosidase